MSDASRQRKRREREQLGIRVYSVECSERTFGALEAAGLLQPKMAEDRDAIQEALNAVLREFEAQFFRHA